MSGQRKKGKGKGKGKGKEDDGAGAFAEWISARRKGRASIYRAAFGALLAGDGANKMWKCSSAPNEEFQKLIKKHRAASC